ncbi:recombination protein Rad52 [Xylariaceae sp. FL0662B]|nr:recombination protein Rad52 [Xylariaceae sp. FL0662B]
MPAPGDQHNAIANPFEEAKPRISEFTATEIATLQSRLEKQLGPEYLSARSGPSGQKVHYIAAEKCIALANEVFGFNGWSSSIQNIQVDFVDENPQTFKISLGLSVIVRVTLRDGTYHEDIGYGHIENCKGKAAAFEKAKKEGTTDALKRTLRNFGNVLGNCIYDKDYLSKVTKMKVGPTKFDEHNLHRHSDFIKREPNVPPVEPKTQSEKGVGVTTSAYGLDALDEDFGDFDVADFGVTDEGHPDEVVLPGSNGQGTSSNDKPQSLPAGNASDQNRSSTNNAPRPMQAPSKPTVQPPRPPQTPNQPPQRPGAPFQGRPNQPQQQQPKPPTHANSTLQAAANRKTNTPPPNGAAQAEPVSFFSARSVKLPPDESTPGTTIIPDHGAKLFDPRADSPSIRKTPGIDHNSSKPLAKTGQHVAPVRRDVDQQQQRTSTTAGAPAPNGFANGAGSGPGRPSMGNVGNPALNHTRQIGVPGGGASPLANRGQYRPLTVKRPAPGGGPELGNRTPLTEVSANNNTVQGLGGGGTDAKRQKIT